MAPRLAPSQLVMIRDVQTFVHNQQCHVQMFGVVRASLTPGGRPGVITPVMLEAPCEYLVANPDLYLDNGRALVR
ncbi:uncharacterized protein ATNIH1004_005296 [Aspergillus tanneri]|uniref:Uncharacterized protein n=1 Tax=Aspergillus tanneri TaxID=1220188 RepID=A0A5M9MQQ3_9EURO|nr:uncharacterized protein ATNIH1004_005296 [Aspergillus tanneri]KAA8649395.1 hypothetical protein ATNIH1004_005296 [Aspergillus tanneri]